MSKNFELLQQVGRERGRRPQEQLFHPPFAANEIERSRSGSTPGSVADHKPLDWLRALEILRRQWKLSALFAFVVIVTVASITYLMKPIYEAVARIEIDPPGEVFSLQG